MAAARMADLLGETVGGTVGYQVRFERHIGARTRIQVLTEGILTRRLQSDPELTGVGLLIFDEFHERSLQADLGLALALDLAAALRPDLRILVMSATLEADAVARLLGDAPVIRAEGRSFPVAVRYAEIAPREPLAAMEQAIREALREQAGDLLAFLPGTGEIERVRARLADTLGEGIAVLPLHGSLTVAEQQRALVPGPDAGRRVVLATDIAETSVTIEGVTTVIDGGLARKPRFHAGSGLTRLVTEPIPLASAQQRAGRAGRLGPGVCYRLWTRAQEVGRAPHRRAEMLDADLAPLALDLALWGLRDPAALRWLDPPPPGSRQSTCSGTWGRWTARGPSRRSGAGSRSCPCTRAWGGCWWPPAPVGRRAAPRTWRPCWPSATAGPVPRGSRARRISGCAWAPWKPFGRGARGATWSAAG